MKYSLRNFENNLQMLNSTGWVLVIVSLILIATQQMPGFLIFTLIGAGMIWLQLRGKRIYVDTSAKTIKSAGKIRDIKNPSQVFMNEVKLSQRVNSRAQSTNVNMYYYKAYLQDGEEKVLLSSNRKESRDMEKLTAIAKDLGVEFHQNFQESLRLPYA